MINLIEHAAEPDSAVDLQYSVWISSWSTRQNPMPLALSFTNLYDGLNSIKDGRLFGQACWTWIRLAEKGKCPSIEVVSDWQALVKGWIKKQEMEEKKDEG